MMLAGGPGPTQVHGHGALGGGVRAAAWSIRAANTPTGPGLPVALSVWHGLSSFSSDMGSLEHGWGGSTTPLTEVD